MPWSGGGHCFATVEQAVHAECLSTSSACAQPGSRFLGYHRPTGKAFSLIPSASSDAPYSVVYVQVNSCASVDMSGAPASSRWGADVETSAYCASSPESSRPDFAEVGQFVSIGFGVVISLFCTAIGLGAVLRIVRRANHA